VFPVSRHNAQRKRMAAEPGAAADTGRILAYRASTALQRPTLLSGVVRPHGSVRRTVSAQYGHGPAGRR
jgi:hypothetical protein